MITKEGKCFKCNVEISRKGFLYKDFDKIQTCIKSNTGNPLYAKVIDKCESFVNNGQLSDYKMCLAGAYDDVAHANADEL